MLSAFAVPNKDRGRDVLDKTTSQGKLHILLLNAIIPSLTVYKTEKRCIALIL